MPRPEQGCRGSEPIFEWLLNIEAKKISSEEPIIRRRHAMAACPWY